ncbi:hypothetical protein [Dietzia maris]|uniref:Uncharacterized protein n=1 Tax=Dietzia maris TaxID=37915 RepID=A0ABT8H4N7_9ACTN|nr:hypothetical protein [Dietzia maris]MDN4507432.1 hypothetical protein [Dietzia maris]
MTDPLFGADSFDHHPAPDVCGLQDAPLAEPSSLGLHVPVGEDVLDLGSPEADLDGDGFMEAVTLGDDRGLTVMMCVVVLRAGLTHGLTVAVAD